MKDHKLNILLWACSSKQLKGFEKHYQSIEVKTAQKEVCRRLIQYRKDDTNPNIVVIKAIISKHYSGDDKARGRKMKKTLNEIYTSLESFLVAQELEKTKNYVPKTILLLSSLQGRLSIDLFKKYNNGTTIDRLRDMPSNVLKDYVKYLNLFHLEHENYFHPFQNNVDQTKKEIKRNKKRSIKRMLEYLEISFCLPYLKCICEMYSLSVFFEAILPPKTDWVLKRSKQFEHRFPSLEIYRLCIELHQSFREDLFLEFKDYVFNNLDSIPNDEQAAIFNMVATHLATARKKGLASLEVIAEVYEQGIEKGYMLEGGQLSDGHFINYISTLCSVGKFSEARQFWGKNSNLLSEKNQDVIKNLGMARILIAEKKPAEVYKVLTSKENDVWTSKPNDFLLDDPYNCFKLIACVDAEIIGEDIIDNKTKKEVFLPSAFETFRKWLDRRKKNKKRKEGQKAIQNFFKLTKKICKVNKALKVGRELDEIEDKIDCTSPLVYKSWLKQKVQQIRTGS